MLGWGGQLICCEASLTAGFVHGGIAYAAMGVLSDELLDLLPQLVLRFHSLSKNISYSVSCEANLIQNRAKEDTFCH